MKKMILLLALTIVSTGLLNGMEVSSDASNIIEKHKSIVENIYGSQQYVQFNNLLKHGPKVQKISLLEQLIRAISADHRLYSNNLKNEIAYRTNEARKKGAFDVPPRANSKLAQLEWEYDQEEFKRGKARLADEEQLINELKKALENERAHMNPQEIQSLFDRDRKRLEEEVQRLYATKQKIENDRATMSPEDVERFWDVDNQFLEGIEQRLEEIKVLLEKR